VLDFVKPVGVMGDFGPAGRDAGLILTQHGLDISDWQKCESARPPSGPTERGT
jgi:hypothetical protein